MITSEVGEPKWVKWVMPFIIFAAIAAAYADSLHGPFIFDDYNAVLSNINTRVLGNVNTGAPSNVNMRWQDRLSTAMSEPPGTVLNGRPLTCLSMALNYYFATISIVDGEPRPYSFGFHVFNVGTHIACALLLYGLLRRTMLMPKWEGRFARNAWVFSGAVALIWALHPLQTESVTYITQRTETMMAMFLLLVLYAMARAAQSDHPVRRLLWWIVAVIACAAGMASKEVMVVTPFLAGLYCWIFLPGKSMWRDRCIFLSLLVITWLGMLLLYKYNGLSLDEADQTVLSTFYWVLAVAPILVGWLLLPRNSRGGYLCIHALFLTWLIIPIELYGADLASKSGYGLTYVGRWPYLRTQAVIIPYYLWLTIWPKGLVIDYFDWPIMRDMWPLASTFAPAHAFKHQIGYFLGWLVPGIVLTVAVIFSAIGCIFRRWQGFLGAWFFLILGPTSSFLPNFTEIAAERRMYLPIASIIILILAFVWDKLAKNAKPFLIAVAVTAGVLGVVTYARNGVYRTSLSIWTDAVEKRPANPRAIFFLGLSYAEQKDWTNARMYDQMSLAILPIFAPARLLQTYISTHGAETTTAPSRALINPLMNPLSMPGGSFPNVPPPPH